VYLNKSIPAHPRDVQRAFNMWSTTKKLMFMALMAALSTILQSAGGFLPGIGYFFSAFATLPILLGTLISVRSGILTYLLAICLLLLIEPTELAIFPFTTGLGLGWTLRALNQRSGILITNGFLLFLGIYTGSKNFTNLSIIC